MKPCLEWGERLLDLVVGTLPPPEAKSVVEHLERCSACASAYTDLRSRQQEIDVALRGIVGFAEPSPSFPMRVVARASAEGRRRRMSWAFALVGGAAIALLLVLLGAPDEPESESILAWRSPTASLLRSPAEALLQSTPRLGDFHAPRADFLGEQEEGVHR